MFEQFNGLILDGFNSVGHQSGASSTEIVLFSDPAFTKDKRVWHTSPEILGLLTQHYQNSGEPIRLLILADHVVRIALPKRTLQNCD